MPHYTKTMDRERRKNKVPKNIAGNKKVSKQRIKKEHEKREKRHLNENQRTERNKQ